MSYGFCNSHFMGFLFGQPSVWASCCAEPRKNLHSLINETLQSPLPSQFTIHLKSRFWCSLKLTTCRVTTLAGITSQVSGLQRKWGGTQTSQLTPHRMTGRGWIIILRSSSLDISQCRHCPCVRVSGPSQPLGYMFWLFLSCWPDMGCN